MSPIKRHSTRISLPHKGSDAWERQPKTIKRFIEQRSDFEALCAEIAYILRKRVESAGIEVAAITSRAKTLNSFLEKLKRKTYADPFAEVTDFAGTRVVCLYPGDLPKVCKIIETEFELLERVDKLDEKQPDQFGYGATHYIARLGRGSSGARYDDLKDLVCEVQVRTVVQDAWAIIQHHLVYKQESQVPRTLQRKLNSLAGLLETADDQFERIRAERESYVSSVRTSVDTPDFLDNELNLDTFAEYLKWKFPDRPLEGWDGQMRMCFDWIDRARFRTLRDIDSLVHSTEPERSEVRKELTERANLGNDADSQLAADIIKAANVEVYWSMHLSSSSDYGDLHPPPEWVDCLTRYKAQHEARVNNE